MGLDHNKDLIMEKKQRDEVVAALPTSLYRPLKENKARNDKVIVLKAAYEVRSTAYQIVFANPGAGTGSKKQTAGLQRASGKLCGARHVRVTGGIK